MPDIKKVRTQITFQANSRTYSVTASGPVELSGNRSSWSKQLEEQLVAQARLVAKQIHAALLAP